ncbi:Uncharacterised protein [Gordonia paraffinivorans]|uniref:Secreted protein n=1 Tax=Gordonia paraffinivorans TaxID=175628 RepID=A0ABD7V5B2_9ACTN|nr:hypothetical protein [Gordonia paraffinivorans]VFA89608.1 Uncharacterised protein [Gordonia paraffinivorans]
MNIAKRAALAVVTIGASIGLVAGIGVADAETPAERCKRETAAYNDAWKNTWAAANPGKKPSDAPKPPVPYKCGGGQDGGVPPTLSPGADTPETKTPEKDAEPSTSDSKGSGGPTSSAPTVAGGPRSTAPTSRRDNVNGVDRNQPRIWGTTPSSVVIAPKQRNDHSLSTPASADGNDGNGGFTSDSSSYADKLSGIRIYANAWACALYFKHCSFATSAKTYRDGQRLPVGMIRNVATAKTHGIKASVEVSGGKGNGGSVSIAAEGTDKNAKSLTWTNTNSYISDVAGTADCGMFSTYFSVTSEGWFEHNGAKGYASAGVRN